jgi:hypothetical protein
MAVPGPNPLLTLARRLRLGRLLRYLDLWVRYLWRRGVSALWLPVAPAGAEAGAMEAARLAQADLATAYRATVGSWFPLDLANRRLAEALLKNVAAARPELGLTSGVIAAVGQLKGADDLGACVDRLAASGEAFATINTALFIFLLRRLPDVTERAMIEARHPRHALIAIRSGDEYRRQGRRMPEG